MTLVILAAGMGSRYGGLKQLDPVGPHGEILLDYSVADAVQAGFSEVLFIIRHEIEKAFRQHLGNRYQAAFPDLKISYAFQDPTDLPENFSLPSPRSKPWGTGHALLAARSHITTPFAVINADDYYGPSGYRLLKTFFETSPSDNTYAMVAYALKNTLSEHGSVSRGICQSTPDHMLLDIIERTSIRMTAEGIRAEEKNQTSIPLTGNEWVSLNFWGFTPSIFSHLEDQFSTFLQHKENHTTAEFYLPSAVNQLVHEKNTSVHLFPSQDPWFGLTHPADHALVKAALCDLEHIK